MNRDDEPGLCPLVHPNGRTCGNASNLSRKVAPFCCVWHRDAYVREQKREVEATLVANCAKVGERVEEQGVVHIVTHVYTDEAYDSKKRKGHRHKSGVFTSGWKLACGERVEYPKAVEQPATCIGCLAAQ